MCVNHQKHIVMTIVSTKEFNANPKKYFDLAVNEQVYIKRGRIRFRLTPDETKRKYKAPDDDLRRAITMDEFLSGVQKDLRKIFEKGKK